MEISQKYRIRRVVTDSAEGGQVVSLIFTPVSGSQTAAGVPPRALGMGDAMAPTEFQMSGIPIAEANDVNVDVIGTFTFTPEEQ